MSTPFRPCMGFPRIGETFSCTTQHHLQVPGENLTLKVGGFFFFFGFVLICFLAVSLYYGESERGAPFKSKRRKIFSAFLLSRYVLVWRVIWSSLHFWGDFFFLSRKDLLLSQKLLGFKSLSVEQFCDVPHVTNGPDFRPDGNWQSWRH